MAEDMVNLALVVTTIALVVATAILAWYTKILGKHANRLNQIEIERNKQRELEVRKNRLRRAIDAGRSIQKLNHSIYATKVLAREKANSIVFCKSVEEMLDYKDLFSDKNRQLLTERLKTVFSYVESAQKPSAPLPQKTALESTILQLKDIVGEEIPLLKAEIDKASSNS